MAKPLSDEQCKEQIIKLLQSYTNHNNIKLLDRGNAAIFAALLIAKKANGRPFILIPDMGGWTTFRTYPKLLGFEVRTIHTNRGIIDLMDLERKAQSGAAFIVTSFAGYFAEQSISYIKDICSKNNCLLIEDVSGSVGDKVLCDGDYADIIVGSFGKWKVVDSGYGGFISCRDKSLLDFADDAFTLGRFCPDYPLLLEKLKDAPSRLSKLLELAGSVRSELKGMGLKVVHPDFRGLNVVVRFESDDEKRKILEYCDDNGYESTECPRYIRLEEPAISIELKRLQFDKKSRKR